AFHETELRVITLVGAEQRVRQRVFGAHAPKRLGAQTECPAAVRTVGEEDRGERIYVVLPRGQSVDGVGVGHGRQERRPIERQGASTEGCHSGRVGEDGGRIGWVPEGRAATAQGRGGRACDQISVGLCPGGRRTDE